MKPKVWIAPLATLLMLVAAQAAERGDGTQAASKTCPAPTPATSYYTASQVDLLGLTAPPPSADSAQQAADLAAVLDAQRAARAAGTLERAIADTELTCARFKDVLGAELKSAAAAKALRLVSGAALNASLAAGPAKRYWKRPRPFLVSPLVERHGDVAVGGSQAWGEYPERHCEEAPPQNAAEAAQRREKQEKDSYERNNTSYPSGHAAFGMACAVLLAGMVPEKRAELFARGRQYGESRLILGAHYPSDVAAGQQMALVGAALVMQNASFERQYVEAQGELRRALGLPAALPDLEPNKDQFKDKDKDKDKGKADDARPAPDAPAAGGRRARR